MTSWLPLAVIVTALAGCSTESAHRALGSPDPEGPPTRYPLDFPICASDPVSGGEIIVPLKMRIYGAGLPDPMRVIAVRRKEPSFKGCPTERSERTSPAVYLKDSYSRTQALDQSGQGYFSASSYSRILLEPSGARSEAVTASQQEQLDADNLRRYGRSVADETISTEDVTFNGIAWKHSLVARYSVDAPGDPPPRTLLTWTDTYEHRFASGYVLKSIGRYGPVVIADQQWLAARRDLARQLVAAIRFEQLTDEQVQAFIVEDARYRQTMDEEYRRGKR